MDFGHQHCNPDHLPVIFINNQNKNFILHLFLTLGQPTHPPLIYNQIFNISLQALVYLTETNVSPPPHTHPVNFVFSMMIPCNYRSTRSKRSNKGTNIVRGIVSCPEIKNGDLVKFRRTKGHDTLIEVGVISFEVEAPSKLSLSVYVKMRLVDCTIIFSSYNLF